MPCRPTWLEAGGRFEDEVVDHGGAGGVDDVRDLGVDERDSLGRESAGRFGEAAYPPGRDLAGDQACPDLGQAVLGLDHVTHEEPAGLPGAAQGRGELRHREVRHLWRTSTGQLEHRVGAGHPEAGDPRVLRSLQGVLVGCPVGAVEVRHQRPGGVEICPLRDPDQQLARGVVLARLGGEDRVEHGGGGHGGSIVEHTFERQCLRRSDPLSWKIRRVCRSPSTASTSAAGDRPTERTATK